jgi:hypothetical protein
VQSTKQTWVLLWFFIEKTSVVAGICYKLDLNELQKALRKTASYIQLYWCNITAALDSKLNYKFLPRFISDNLLLTMNYRVLNGAAQVNLPCRGFELK